MLLTLSNYTQVSYNTWVTKWCVNISVLWDVPPYNLNIRLPENPKLGLTHYNTVTKTATRLLLLRDMSHMHMPAHLRLGLRHEHCRFQRTCNCVRQSSHYLTNLKCLTAFLLAGIPLSHTSMYFSITRNTRLLWLWVSTSVQLPPPPNPFTGMFVHLFLCLFNVAK
jgi:hypothetical protein